jgi:acyl carrier protein
MTIGSKVQASWNLHLQLPGDIDFYILLSSLAGIYGSVSQSNYAAGCTFQDALARARTSAGLPASVSLDLGWMRTIGIVAENEDYQRNRQHARDMQPVEEADFLALLDYYCDPDLPRQDGPHSQLLVGAVHPVHFQSRGEALIPSIMRPLFAGFTVPRSTLKNRAGGSVEDEDVSLLFMKASGSKKNQASIILTALKGKLARALGVPPEDIDQHKALADYGVDSLMAVELRTWIRRDFRAAVAVFEIMGETSIEAVVDLVVDRAE